MHSLEAQWLGQTITSLEPVPSWTPGRCSVPSPGGVTLRGLTDLLTRGSFHPGYKMFTCPPAGWGAHCGCYRQQTALGWEIAVSRGGKVGRGPRGMQKRRGNTSWQRAEPTGVADGPRPPPARLGRHKCVSVRVPDWRGITSNHTRLPQQHHRLGHAVLSSSNQRGVPGDGGDALLPLRRMRLPPSPWDPGMPSLCPGAAICVVPLP